MTEPPAPNAPSLMTADNLVKHLGGKRVVDGVSLRCERGRVLGLLGPNGAGKTTTLRMLYGFLQTDGGSITFEGTDVTGQLTPAKRWIGVCTQNDTADEDHTVVNNLRVAAGYFRPRPDDLEPRIESLLDRFELRDYRHHKPDQLSGGYRRRLMLARAVVHRPRLLFLDEPTTGLDPQARLGVWDLVDSLRAEGMGIVLTTHYMDEAERLSDELVVLAKGRVVAGGTTRAVLGDLVGEHVVVVAADAPDVQPWLTEQSLDKPARILGEWHVPLTGHQLALFADRFPDLRYEVRRPTLDDLFLKLAVST